MEPPGTMLPSNRLTPSRCELLSRPLLELPCPFLCAMTLHLASISLIRTRVSVRPVSLRPAEALAALLLEHPDFRAARSTVHDRDDARVGHVGGPGEHLAPILADEKHLLESHLIAGRHTVDRSTVTTIPGLTLTCRPPL